MGEIKIQINQWDKVEYLKNLSSFHHNFYKVTKNIVDKKTYEIILEEDFTNDDSVYIYSIWIITNDNHPDNKIFSWQTNEMLKLSF